MYFCNFRKSKYMYHHSFLEDRKHIMRLLLVSSTFHFTLMVLIMRDDAVITWSKSNYIFVKKSVKEFFFLGRTFIAWVNHMHYLLSLHFFAKQREICLCDRKDLKIYCEQNTSSDSSVYICIFLWLDDPVRYNPRTMAASSKLSFLKGVYFWK